MARPVLASQFHGFLSSPFSYKLASMMTSSMRHNSLLGLCCLPFLYAYAAILAVPVLPHDSAAQPIPDAATQVVTLARDAHLTIEMRTFDPQEHELTICEHNWVCLIDGYPVFGAEGAAPSIQVTSIHLSLGGQVIELEHKGMYNPWPPSDEGSHIRIVDDSPNGLRIRGEFSDGSAGYFVEWLVISGGSARVLIDCVECASDIGGSMNKWSH